MSQQVRLNARPGQTVRFPNECASCGREASERMPAEKRAGQTTRRVDVPICADCGRILARRSGEEERRLRLGRVLAGAAGLLAGGLVTLIAPGGWPLRLVLGVVVAAVAGLLVWRWAEARAERAALPEKQAVRESARLVDFSWRGLTLEFARDGFAERVRELNADLLPEQGTEPLPDPPPPGEGTRAATAEG